MASSTGEQPNGLAADAVCEADSAQRAEQAQHADQAEPGGGVDLARLVESSLQAQHAQQDAQHADHELTRLAELALPDQHAEVDAQHSRSASPGTGAKRCFAWPFCLNQRGMPRSRMLTSNGWHQAGHH